MTGPSVRTDIVDVYVFRCLPKRDPGIGSTHDPEDTRNSGESGKSGGSGGSGGRCGATFTTAEFLQMRRVGGSLGGSWHPVMGHIESGETGVTTGLRELHEETGYRTGNGNGLIGFWQLEVVNTYFLAAKNVIMMNPCFAAQVTPDIEPRLDASHDASRWVRRDHVDREFLWPGQRTAIDQIVRDILPDVQGNSETVARYLRIDLKEPGQGVAESP